MDGSVNPNGTSTSYWFKYGTNTSYGSLSKTNSAGSGSVPVNVGIVLSNLTQNTTYHYEIVASSTAGTQHGH